MKSILTLLLLTSSLVHATALGMAIIKQPLYLHGSDMDAEIRITDVPVVMNMTVSETYIGAIVLPFVPPATSTWRAPHDINLASLYGISVHPRELRDGGMEVTIDTSKARVPDGYPFTVEQVADAVLTCVKLMRPVQPGRILTIQTVAATQAKTEKADDKTAPQNRR